MSSPASGADADGLLEFDVEFDEELLRRLARDLVLKQLGIGYLVAGTVVVCAFAAFLASGDRSWIVGALGFCIAVVLLLPWFAWRLQLKQSLATLRRLDPPRVHVEAGDEDLRFTSSAGSMVVRWSEMKKMLKTRDAWILFFPPQHVTVPFAGLDESVRSAFESRLRGAGM